MLPKPFGGGDLQPSVGRSRLSGEQRLGHGQLGEDLAHRAVQRLALLGQDQAARMPVEQRDLQRSSSAWI
jgi:hypothetical protein